MGQETLHTKQVMLHLGSTIHHDIITTLECRWIMGGQEERASGWPE